MISLVFLATVINYLDRQTLSVVAPALRDQFRMSNTEYGWVVFAFMLAYTVMNGASGILIDRLGTRLGYALFVLWWSVATALHAFASGIWTLGIFRFLLGIGEAGNWPAGVKVVGEWFPERERALAAGIFNSGSAIGAILAPPAIVWIVLRFGWPASFLAVGASGLLWLTFWWMSYRPPEKVGEEIPAPRRYGFRVLLRTPFVLWFTVAKIFIDPAWYFYTFWFPEYLHRVRGFDLAAIGEYAWIPFAVAGFGNLLGGAASAWLLKVGFPLTAARNLTVLLFAALMAFAIPAVFVADARWSIAFVSLAMMGYTGSTANMLAMPTDVFSHEISASVYGIASMGAGFGGMVFSLLTGWAVDHASYTPVFVGFGLMPLVCALILWTLAGPAARLKSVQQLQSSYAYQR
ncbi:MAG: MFS transporter [Bryobacteraceae bacterium]|nr:MFS transporter [Bryobacteraceae bacterium]